MGQIEYSYKFLNDVNKASVRMSAKIFLAKCRTWTGSTIPWTGPGFWTGLDSGLDSWIMAQFCTRAFSEARPTSRCPSYSPRPMQELDFQYKCWYLISMVSLWGSPTPRNHQKFSLKGGEMRACFLKSIPCPQARLTPRFLVGVETGYLSPWCILRWYESLL